MKKIAHCLGGLRIPTVGLALFAAGSLMVGAVSVLAGGATRTPREGQPRQQSAERYLEIAEIKGTVIYETENLKSEGRQAKVGDRLRVSGDGIRTGSNSSVKLVADNNIGSVDVSENSNLQVKSLTTSPNGAKATNLATNRGRTRVRVRTFNNPRSRFTIQTPSSLAGVRGTEFTVIVLPDGETKVYTEAGMVEVSGQNQIQEIKPGYFTAIAPGKPPTSPSLTSGNLRVGFQLLPAPDEGKVKVSGAINPMNTVALNGDPLTIDAAGKFEAIATIPISRRLTIVVRTPLGEEQVSELVVP